MVLIRAAVRGDAEAIAHVHIDSWRTTYAGLVPAAYLAALDEVERAVQWREWLTLEVTVLVAFTITTPGTTYFLRHLYCRCILAETTCLPYRLVPR